MKKLKKTALVINEFGTKEFIAKYAKERRINRSGSSTVEPITVFDVNQMSFAMLFVKEMELVGRFGMNGCDEPSAKPTLQLIPYILLRNERGEILTYRRGASGDEKGLHEKTSLGLGGHIEYGVDKPESVSGKNYIVSLQESFNLSLIHTAMDELKEELGLDTSIAIDARNYTFIYSNDDVVSKRHLGVLMTVDVKSSDVLLSNAEKDVIVNAGWVDYTQIDFLHESTLEPWSQHVLAYLRETNAPADKS